MTKRETGFMISGFLKQITTTIITKVIKLVIKFANHVHAIIESSHDTNATERKNNAHADNTINTPTTVIADNKIVSFSIAVSFK